MDKNEAFETLVQVVMGVKGFSLAEARAVDEAISVLGKEIGYEPKEQEPEVEDLEKTTREKK